MPWKDERWLRPAEENSSDATKVVTGRKEALEERLRSQARELALLNRVRSAVAHELEVPGVLSRTVEAVAETCDHTRLKVYLLEGEELVLEHQVGHHEVNGRIPATEGVFGRAVRTGHPVLVEDPDPVGSTDGVTSEICVPLFDGGRLWDCSACRAWAGRS